VGFVNSSTLALTTTDTTPTMFNLTIALADTEQSQLLPANTKEFIIRTRGLGSLKLAFIAAESGSKFVTIPGRANLTVTQLFSSQTIFFQSPVAGEIIELLTFS